MWWLEAALLVIAETLSLLFLPETTLLLHLVSLLASPVVPHFWEHVHLLTNKHIEGTWLKALELSKSQVFLQRKT